MSTSPAPSQAPTAANPIARAAQLLREGAQELKEYGWTAEPEAKAVYDEYLAVAAALDAFQYEKPLAGAMTAAAMPSDDEVDAVLKLCGWLSETRHDAERRRQIRCSFRRTVHEAFRLGVEAARRPQPEPHTDMPDFWSVDVHVDAERLVSIGHNWLSGKELGQAEERAIIGAAQHLLAFVGFGLPRPDFDPDADEAADHGAVTGELAAHQPSASSAAARPSAELADYHGPDDTPHPVLIALSEHDNPCEDTEEALARIAALRTEIDSLRPYLQRAQARAEAQAGNVEATVQASPGYPLLAKKHTGSRVNYRGLLGQCQSILRRHGGGGYAEMLRQLEGHIKQLGERWYAGDTAVVDEMLQLYCVESQLREALSLSLAEHKCDVALLESPAAAREPTDPMDWPLPCDVTVGHGTMGARAVQTPDDGWLQDGSLLYRLTDERCPQNRDEINVTMADGSRSNEARERRAGELLNCMRAINAAPQHDQWRSAVVEACMPTEACFDGSDPKRSIKNLIDWHLSNERLHVAQSAASQAEPAASPVPPLKRRDLNDEDMDQLALWLGQHERGEIGFAGLAERIIVGFSARGTPASVQASIAGPNEIQEIQVIAEFLRGAKDRFGRPDASANNEMRAAREAIRASAMRHGVTGGHHTYIDQCAAVLAVLASKIGGAA